MNKSLFLITAIACLTTGYVKAQIGVTVGRSSLNLSTINMEPRQIDVIDGVATMSYTNNPAKINGSPYLYDEFMDGTMTGLNGTVVPGLKYRYDIYADKMQFIISGDTATINKPMALHSIELGDQLFVYDVYMVVSDMVATAYFEVIEANEYLTVLYKREIKLDQDIYVPNYGAGGGTKEFRMNREDNYYVKYMGSAAQKINNKKQFLKIIMDHQDQVKQYMKEERLSVKKAEDLQSIASYYNSLKETGS